jgi:hypothetical protein
MTVGGTVVVPGLAPPLSSFDARTGAELGIYAPEGDRGFQGPPVIDTEPRPFQVSLITVLRDGRVTGLRPTALMFREAAVEPISALPGRALTREAIARGRP